MNSKSVQVLVVFLVLLLAVPWCMAAEPEVPAKETQPASASKKPDAIVTEKQNTGITAVKQDAVTDAKQSAGAEDKKAAGTTDKPPAAVEEKIDAGAAGKAPVGKDEKVNASKSDTDINNRKITNGNYIIGPGDILYISVWRDDVLTKDVVVLPDGKISFPLIGEVDAGGRKLRELRQEMESRLSSYVQDVVLTIEVKQVNSMLVYVIGRVNNPGRQILNTNATVLQVLAAAGGLNPFARRSRIKIIRQTENITQVFRFDYDDVADGSNLEQNIILKRGDVIVVP